MVGVLPCLWNAHGLRCSQFGMPNDAGLALGIRSSLDTLTEAQFNCPRLTARGICAALQGSNLAVLEVRRCKIKPGELPGLAALTTAPLDVCMCAHCHRLVETSDTNSDLCKHCFKPKMCCCECSDESGGEPIECASDY
jgi:hypothetical protein